MTMKSKPTFIMLAISFLGVVIGVIAREPLVALFRKVPKPQPVQVKLPPSPEEAAKPHLDWAEQESQRSIKEHVEAIDSFFTDAKKNTGAFADEALSWASKWRLIVDHVPFTSGGKHEAFIRSKFEECVFKPSQLEESVKQVVASYLKHVESIEGEMLVRIRADVADFPSTYLVAQMDENKIHDLYEQALSRAMASTGSSLSSDVGQQLVSIITGEVLTQVLIRLGVSSAILGTGAASSVATLGIGLIVGLIIDQLVAWVWDWYADPRGNLTTELNKKLDEINRLIVDGSADGKGLRQRLTEYATERGPVRTQPVLSILHQR
jgi:hypothetical protein